MSEKTEVDQNYNYDVDEDASQLSENVLEHQSSCATLEHQYSRAQLLNISQSPLSVRRPKCLDPAYDCEDGKWDPDRWYRAQFEQSGDVSPLTLADAKDRRRVNDLDRDLKRRPPAANDSVERLKEERDGIVLSPQRRSFGTGCHVQTTHTYPRQLNLPDRDREEARVEKERDRDSRERPVRKIGSGRIPIDRENSRDYSNLRDRFDDRDIRELDQDRERDFPWTREREREWDRDVRDRDTDWDRDRDRRFDRDRFRRVGDRNFSDRDRRDRDFRERGFDRNTRRRNNYRDDEKEPEWFTGGPSSQTDTIELRGFDREGVNGTDESGDSKQDRKSEEIKVTTPSEDRSSKESSEGTSEADAKVSQRSSPDEDQQMLNIEQHDPQPEEPHQEEELRTVTPQQTASPSRNFFDINDILSANFLPLEEDSVCQGSRFSRFFSGVSGHKLSSDTSSIEDMLVPRDLLEDIHSGPRLLSPTSMMCQIGLVASQSAQVQLDFHQFSEQSEDRDREQVFSLPHSQMSVPNSAGDNSATFDKSAMPPSVTAFFNRAARGGSGPPTPSNSNISTQEAEAQLKAMLFGGHKDSAPSSGTASPSSLPPSVQRKVKTVAELEADMHQNSPQKTSSSVSVASSVSNAADSGDMTAFNKLLILINAASETCQTVTQIDPQTSDIGFGVVSSQNESSHAVLRNKEEQIQLQQQSVNQHPLSPRLGVPPRLPPPSLHSSHPQNQTQMLQTHPTFQQPPQVHQQPTVNHSQQISGLISKPPSTPVLHHSLTSHPNTTLKPRAQGGGPVLSSDPVYSLIQQNPTIVMNPASPGPTMSALMAPQQPAVPSSARIQSPLMFSQQPPLHLSAPSPIHPGQLSPRSLAIGTNLATSPPTGMRSPVLPRVLSPQELSAHAQAVMQSALIKKQLLDQSERYLKKQQERAKSPSQLHINLVKPQSSSHSVPPSLQTKGMPVNPFTPTSVLRKMHSDKALEKEKQAMEGKPDEEMELMSSLCDRGDLGDLTDGLSRKSDVKLVGDLGDISFLDPVNPNLVTLPGQLENQLRLGQANILPGPLSQPMSVEEKMRLSALAEKPGFLSQILDKSARAAAAAAEAARTGHGRPIVKAPEPTPEDKNLYAMQQQHPPPSVLQCGRPVTGGSPKIQPSFVSMSAVHSNVAHFSSLQSSKPTTSGRAIVGGNSVQQQLQVPVVAAQNIDVLRMLDLQRLPHSQGMVLPPPPMGTPIACLGPPPVAIPVAARVPVVHPASAAMLHQQIVRANTISAQNSQQMSHFMAMQQAQQHRKMAPLPSLHMVMPGVSAPLSPRGLAPGPLSPAALSATIQRVTSPHGTLKMNGPVPPTSTVNGGGGPKVDVTSGIQRWFSPEILKTQLPSMPPIPAKGSKVMTVDELEGN